MDTDTQTPTDAETLDQIITGYSRIKSELGKTIIGQEDVIDEILISLFAGGHVLITGAPGLAKTLLVKSIAEIFDLQFSRIQFTPDLMPADITGSQAMTQGEDGTPRLTFRKGPIFAHLVLADEINRATPKTQSALLEAMQEQTVTVAGETLALPEPFFVVATQNPIEMEGTYPLPEAQLDRFLMKLIVPFPDVETLTKIGLETTGVAQKAVQKVLDVSELLKIQTLVREVVLAPDVARCAAVWVQKTHVGCGDPIVSRSIRFGASPRAVQSLILAGRAHALVQGRTWVSVDDLRAVAVPVLAHRIVLAFDAVLDGVRAETLISSIVQETTE